MSEIRNVLFVIADQLRSDALTGTVPPGMRFPWPVPGAAGAVGSGTRDTPPP